MKLYNNHSAVTAILTQETTTISHRAESVVRLMKLFSFSFLIKFQSNRGSERFTWYLAFISRLTVASAALSVLTLAPLAGTRFF